MKRREFSGAAGISACSDFLSSRLSAAAAVQSRPNTLFLTADDMNCDSVGAFGCKLA